MGERLLVQRSMLIIVIAVISLFLETREIKFQEAPGQIYHPGWLDISWEVEEETQR